MSIERVAIIGIAVVSIAATGCTSYSGCKSTEDRVVARYEQNIIRDEDSGGYAFWKGVKHGFFDIVTLATCEIWYSHVRSAYYESSAYGFVAADKQRMLGQKDLDSFLGIKIGEPLSGNSDDCFDRKPCGNNPDVFTFLTKRSFSPYNYSYRVYVTPKDRKVWKIIAGISFAPSKDELAAAEARDRSGPVTSYTSGSVTKDGCYSGTTTSYQSHRAYLALMESKSWTARNEQRRLHKMMERKYGKEFHNGIMAFENNRYLIVPEIETYGTYVEICVADRSLSKQVSDTKANDAVVKEKQDIDAF